MEWFLLHHECMQYGKKEGCMFRPKCISSKSNLPPMIVCIHWRWSWMGWLFSTLSSVIDLLNFLDYIFLMLVILWMPIMKSNSSSSFHSTLVFKSKRKFQSFPKSFLRWDSLMNTSISFVCQKLRCLNIQNIFETIGWKLSVKMCFADFTGIVKRKVTRKTDR